MTLIGRQVTDKDSLWREFSKCRSEESREQLIASYAYLAKYIVDRLNLHPSGAICYDDLLSHAIIGLLEAIDKFEWERGIRFESFAIPRIRGAVIDALRSLDWVPRSVRREEGLLKKAMADLEAGLKRPPSDQELAERLGVELDELEDMLARMAQSALLSLDEALAACGDNQELEMCRRDGEATTPDPYAAVEIAETKETLARAISELPERERLVISLYYFDGLTVKEIAAVLGVTVSRVSQLHTKGVLRLAGKLERADVLALAA